MQQAQISISYLEIESRKPLGTGTYYFKAVPVPPFHYSCWAATPNYPMYTSLLSITEPYHYYPSISRVYAGPLLLQNDSYDLI
jgi:hypothetical protein